MIISSYKMPALMQKADVAIHTQNSSSISSNTLWQRAFVGLATKNDQPDHIRTYILHKSSGELYLDEPSSTTRCKCAFIALSAPIFAAYRTLVYLLRALFDVYVITNEHLRSCKVFSSSCCSDLRELLQDRIIENLSSAALAPVMMISSVFLGALGVIAPWHARRMLAFIEKSFHGGISVKGQFTILDVVNYIKSIDSKDLLPFIKHNEIFFHAPCFQQKGNIFDKQKFILHHTENI